MCQANGPGFFPATAEQVTRKGSRPGLRRVNVQGGAKGTFTGGRRDQASIKKRGDGELWQQTADWRKRDDEEPTARSELRISRGQNAAEKNSQKRGTFQVEATKSKGEKSKRDKAEVLVTVSEAVQKAKSQPVAEERAKIDAQGVQPSVAVRLSKSNSAERSTTQELVRVVKDSEEREKCVLREQRGGERRIAKGKALEMPEAEVKETVKVKLP